MEAFAVTAGTSALLTRIMEAFTVTADTSTLLTHNFGADTGAE